MPQTPVGLRLTKRTLSALRRQLPEVADQVVAAIIDEVPSYADALSGPMGANIRTAVQLALGGFISLAGRGRAGDPRTPTAPAVDGAYQLGRGEARSGRTADALLSAYRIGARVAWQRMSETAVEQGVDAGSMARFAELVFAYIDELSAASVAGHTDELATTGRVRQRLLERLATQLLEGAPAETVAATAERADWQLPETLTAVLVPESQVRTVLQALPGETLSAPEGATEEAEDGMVLLLVPGVHGHRRGAVLRVLEGRGSVAGPARTPDEVAASYARAQRVRALGGGPDSEEHLAALVLHADEGALQDLRARVLAPLDDVREGTREKLEETLRAWLLHHGRREDVAAELFVHPQTVRYRMTQLRELFGDALEDPARVLDLTLALGSAAG